MSYDFVVTIEGTRQGWLTDDPAPADRAHATGRILGLSYSHEVAGRGAGTGVGQGRRTRHSPIVFSKRWGPASPQLFSALTTGELLPVVRFEFNDRAGRRASASGLAGHATILIVVLTDAWVDAIRYTSAEGGEELEFVSLGYRNVRIESPAGATGSDDWTVHE